MNRRNDNGKWIDRETFAAYLGGHPEKLLKFYDRATETKNGTRLSLNWSAILFFPGWLSYRRQWALLVSYLVLLGSIPFIEGGFGFSLSSTSMLGPLAAIGAMGNSFLLMNANNLFNRYSNQGMDLEAVRTALLNKAAPSVKYAVLGGLGSLVWLVGTAVIAELVFPTPMP